MLCLQKKKLASAHLLVLCDQHIIFGVANEKEKEMCLEHTKYSHVWSLCICVHTMALTIFSSYMLFCLQNELRLQLNILLSSSSVIFVHLAFHLFKWIIIIFSLLTKKLNDWLLWFVQRFFLSLSTLLSVPFPLARHLFEFNAHYKKSCMLF